MARGEAYDLIQSAARKVWVGDGDLQSHLAADPRVSVHLDPERLASLFDASYHLRGIETAFARLGLV